MGALILCDDGNCWIEGKVKEKDSEQEGSSLGNRTKEYHGRPVGHN